MKKFLALFLVLILFCACAQEPKDLTEGYTQNIENLTGTPSEKFKDAQYEFAVELLKENFKDENALFSPLSVKLALAMTLNGAGGETKAQMEEVLGLSTETLNEEIYKYVSSLSGDEIQVANSIWINDDGEFIAKEDFLQANADYYGAGVFKETFNNSTVRKVNSWVKENTDGMIDNIVDESVKDSRMLLINALAFEAEWSDVYKKDQVSDGTFTSVSGEKQKVKMMSSTEYYYLEDASATGFMKKYRNGKYAFVALLPKNDIGEYIENLNGADIKNLIANQTKESVKCKLPKFSYDYSVTLNEALKNMGMPNAFDIHLADFSNLSQRQLYIDKVLHKTHIEVGEKGTKAGAATVVAMNDAAAEITVKPKEVILDRPFVYMIIDTQSNLPIFIGALTDVK